MFKNSLFLKIIMVFTLPALGILYFSTVLVLEKVDSMKEIHSTYDNLNYMENTEKLLHSLQKERGLSVTYNESKAFKDQLNNQKAITDEKFNSYIEFVKKDMTKSGIESKIKDIQDRFFELNNIRNKTEEFSFSSLEIINLYTKINEQLLDSIYSLKSIKSATNFNNDFLNIFYFLSFKEQVGIERALISLALIKGEVSDSIKEELIKTYTKQKVNFDYFHAHSSVKILDIYNRQLLQKVLNEIDQIKFDLDNNKNLKSISLENWWKLSSSKIDSLDNILQEILKELKQVSKKTQHEAFISQNLSFVFLFISFSTLISLLFVLKKIIFDERKSVEKIEKHKKVYELLNETNKYLLKKENKHDLYTEIHNLISKNPSMVFSFIYDLEENREKNRIYAQEGNLKNFLISKLEDYKNSNKDNLLTKAIELQANVIVESFENSNISIFSATASKYEIRSAAAFPVKKFNEVVSVLLIYSKENNFFDYEVEILFDKMIVDMSHSLEKFDYEKARINQENQLRISSVAFESSEPMLITDKKAQIIMVNQAFCNIMGYKREMLIGRNPRIFKSLYHNKDFYISMWDKLSKNNSWKGEIYNTTGKGETIPIRLIITAIKDSNNNITNYLAQYIDISEQKDKEKILEYQATHDNLTGLPNRLLLLDRIEHALTRVVRHKIVGGLIFIDLDNFKVVNDTLGHDIGDALLIMVAKSIKDVIREEDTIARIGGDEFIVLLDNIGSNKEDARINIANLAEKIKDTLNAITHIEGHINVSTPSIGVTLFSDASVSVKDIIKQADTAMYAAKKQGKNSIEFFD